MVLGNEIDVDRAHPISGVCTYGRCTSLRSEAPIERHKGHVWKIGPKTHTNVPPMAVHSEKSRGGAYFF